MDCSPDRAAGGDGRQGDQDADSSEQQVVRHPCGHRCQRGSEERAGAVGAMEPGHDRTAVRPFARDCGGVGSDIEQSVEPNTAAASDSVRSEHPCPKRTREKPKPTAGTTSRRDDPNRWAIRPPIRRPPTIPAAAERRTTARPPDWRSAAARTAGIRAPHTAMTTPRVAKYPIRSSRERFIEGATLAVAVVVTCGLRTLGRSAALRHRRAAGPGMVRVRLLELVLAAGRAGSVRERDRWQADRGLESLVRDGLAVA